MSGIQWLERAAQSLDMTPAGVISHVVRGYRFSNEQEVIAQRLQEYREGYVCDYIMSFCVAVVREGGAQCTTKSLPS